MKIIVCVKQVPLSRQAYMDESTGVLIRATAGAVTNPYDLYAVEAALQAANTMQAEVVALCMGPQSAADALREALAMGANRAILLCDKVFAGADVLATAFTLSQAIEKDGGADLIICGQQSTDGDTAQLPFSLAAQLGYPAIGWIKSMQSVNAAGFRVEQEMSGYTQLASGGFPAVWAVGMQAVQPRVPSLVKRLAARKAAVQQWCMVDLPVQDEARYGLQGSPTRVKRVYTQFITAKMEPLYMQPSQAANLLLHEMEQANGRE